MTFWILIAAQKFLPENSASALKKRLKNRPYNRGIVQKAVYDKCNIKYTQKRENPHSRGMKMWAQRRAKWTMDKTPVEVDNKMFYTFWNDDEAWAHDTNYKYLIWGR